MRMRITMRKILISTILGMLRDGYEMTEVLLALRSKDGGLTPLTEQCVLLAVDQFQSQE